MSSSFGNALKITIFGQSHAPAIGVCMEGAVIVLACLIYTAFLSSSSPAVDPSLPAATMAFQYIGQMVFNMLVLTGLVKGSDRIVKEMFGL